MGQTYSRRNLNFMLHEVHDVMALTQHPYFSAHDAAGFGMVLDTAETIAAKYLRPFFVDADRNPPELINNQVTVHPGIANYYQAFCETGLMAACFDEAVGGQQLPKTVYAAADFILGNAHNGFEMFTSLTLGAAELLHSFASVRLKSAFLNQLLTGESTATMCLTETQAGSSLGDIETLATPIGNGDYKITGQKIFISAGDHTFTENIIHLVLAREKCAPAGTKGISLFLVPKKRKGANGDLIGNDVCSVGVYHKMGQRSTPAMHLQFGENGDCIGHIIGEGGKGLGYMFQMMNGARLGVGLAGTYIASAAYYTSLKYAHVRQQGRRLDKKTTGDAPVTIIHHPDVRRMLFLQKAFVEGSLSLLLQCYTYLDMEKVGDAQTNPRLNDLLQLLTPVAKTYGAEMGIISVNNGLQVLGGYGYTEDFILEQLARDVRIMAIYEGTTGIQSQALLGRQIPMHNCRALSFWMEEVQGTIGKARTFTGLKTNARQLSQGIGQLEKVTQHLLLRRDTQGTEQFLSDANLYMEFFSLLNIGWQWLKQGIIAQTQLNSNVQNKEEMAFYGSKLETMRYFFHYELIKTQSLAIRLMDDTPITLFKENDPLI